METFVLGTVMSHLDYCNGILAGLPDEDISKMQHVQNIAAVMVVQNDTSMKDTSSKNILAKLHWLSICRRIQHKMLTLVHKCMSCKALGYQRNPLIKYPYSKRREGPQNSKARTKKEG